MGDNNILTSLLYAEAEMDDGFLFTYSDIVFSREHARRVAAANGPVALIVDRRWRDAYEGRTLHPVSEAELARVTGAGDDAAVTRVGKRLVAAEEAAGEFTGLARFAPAGAAALRAVWAEALGRGLDSPFGAAATLRQAYLTTASTRSPRVGWRWVPVLVDGGWREIDTEQDLARAELVVDSWGRDMPGRDPGHWLHRFDAAEWLAAAETELAHARGEARAPRRPPRRDARAPRRRHGLERGAGDGALPRRALRPQLHGPRRRAGAGRRRTMRRSPPRSARPHGSCATPRQRRLSWSRSASPTCARWRRRRRSWLRADTGRQLAASPYVSENGYDTTWLPFDGGNRIPPTTPLMHP